LIVKGTVPVAVVFITAFVAVGEVRVLLVRVCATETATSVSLPEMLGNVR